jgi:hypothetical protein
MILPDLVLPSRVNQHWEYSGIDSPESCFNKEHFKKYPYQIDYSYNSRGFRDDEWPGSSEELEDAIWCVGDSFTVGIGQPLKHIWPYVLAKRSNRRTINISMDGASNDWICRRAEQIQTEIGPRYLIVMWSYTHRRESVDMHLTDERRRIHASRVSANQDLAHWYNLVSRLRGCCNNNMIESTIPDFHPGLHILKKHWQAVKDPSWPRCPETLDEFDSLPDYILKELEDLHRCHWSMRSFLAPDDVETPPTHIDTSDMLHVIERLDWARDHHHFDVLTSEWLVDQILQRMETLDFARNDLLPRSEH